MDVHAVVTGRSDGPVVLLSNSLGSTHRMWDAQLDVLNEHFRVVRYDTRGHGESPVPDGPYSIDDLADDVVALLDRLGVARAHVVGPVPGRHDGDATGRPQPRTRRPSCAAVHGRSAGAGAAPGRTAPQQYALKAAPRWQRQSCNAGSPPNILRHTPMSGRTRTAW